MFYAWLPLLYALIGFDVRLLLVGHFGGCWYNCDCFSELLARLFLMSRLMYLSPIGACCLVFPAVSYLAFPWPPLSASMVGLWLLWQSARISLRGGWRLTVPRFFDMFVIGASAVGGAAMVMTGANHIFHGVGVDLAAGGV